MLTSHSPSQSPILHSSYSSSSGNGNGNGSGSSGRFSHRAASPRQVTRRPSSSSSSSTSAQPSRHSAVSPTFTTPLHPPPPPSLSRQRTPVTTADASTQYSPPEPAATLPSSSIQAATLPSSSSQRAMTASTTSTTATTPNKNKRRETSSTSPTSSRRPSTTQPVIAPLTTSALSSISKRPRPPPKATKLLPRSYEDCPVKDLVTLISDMLMELIRFNDDIPLKDGRLTRFHSRAPPTISVPDYLLRLTTHATLSPPLLLSMVYYIDRLCALYPPFIISSLTVHRFLIVSATVASKGLSDSFWTNNTYARVGGVSLRELALLELEFLEKVDWRIVPWGGVLEAYYASLVARAVGFEIEGETDEGRREGEAEDGKEEEEGEGGPRP